MPLSSVVAGYFQRGGGCDEVFATLWAPTVDFQSMLQRCRLEHKLLQGSSDATLKLACLAAQQKDTKNQEKEKLFSCKLSRSW